jgi:hypothetical protein
MTGAETPKVDDIKFKAATITFASVPKSFFTPTTISCIWLVSTGDIAIGGPV